jgi:outer membrane protein assembly factor BamA
VRIQLEPDANGVRVLLIAEPAVYFGIFQFPGAGRFPYSQLIQAANYPVQTPFNTADVEEDTNKLLTFLRQEGYFEATVDSEVRTDAGHGIANVVFHADLGRCAKFGDIQIDGVTAEEHSDLTRSLQTLMARLRGSAIRPGHAYGRSSLSKAAQSMQSELEKQGWLGAQVNLQGVDYHADTNRADIHFDVKLGESTQVQIEGAHLWNRTRKSLLPIYQGVGVDDESVQEGRQALESYYQGKGFFDVKVDAQLKNEHMNALR